MPNDEKLLLFYEEMVNELQLDKETSHMVYTEALIILLLNPQKNEVSGCMNIYYKLI